MARTATAELFKLNAKKPNQPADSKMTLIDIMQLKETFSSSSLDELRLIQEFLSEAVATRKKQPIHIGDTIAFVHANAIVAGSVIFLGKKNVTAHVKSLRKQLLVSYRDIKTRMCLS